MLCYRLSCISEGMKTSGEILLLCSLRRTDSAWGASTGFYCKHAVPRVQKLLELSEIWLMAERLIPISSRPFQGKQVPAPIYSDVKSEEKRENTAEWWSRRWVTGHVYGNATGRLLCLYYVFVASKSGILISCQLTPTCEGWTDFGFDWGWHFAIKLWTNLLNPFTEKLPLKARSGRQPSTLWTWWRIKTK